MTLRPSYVSQETAFVVLGLPPRKFLEVLVPRCTDTVVRVGRTVLLPIEAAEAALLSSSRDEELLRLYVLPHLRDVRVDEFDLHDAEVVMANLPEVGTRTKRALAPATRRHVAQVMSRVMHLAVYPGKWRPASPIPKGWLPSLPPRDPQ